jgi:hypothetical protein
MSAGTVTPPTANNMDQERQRVGRLLDEIARLCEAEIPPAGFFGEMLKRLLDALSAPAGAVWLRTGQGNIQLQYHINIKQSGMDKSEQARQAHDALLTLAFNQKPAKPMHVPPNSGVGGEANGQAPAGNPSDNLLLLTPIVENDEVRGVIEVWQNPNRPANAIPGFLHYMSLVAELCLRYLRNQRMSQLTGQQQLWTQLEIFARQVHGSLNPVEVAYIAANEGRRLIECDRVSIALRYGRRVVIEAISGADVVERRSNLVVLLRKLCYAVIIWGEKLVYNGVKDDSLPPKVIRALDEYLAESNSRLLVIYPLRDEREGPTPRNPPRSALVMECFEAPVEPEQLTARAEVVARHATPALYNAVEHRRIPMRWIWMPLAMLQEGLGGTARTIMALVCVALTTLITALILLPYPLKMDANGKLMPTIRSVTYPPVAGKVNEFKVAPGENVDGDRVLVKMSDAELETKMSKLRTEIASAGREAAALAKQEQEQALQPSERLKLSSEVTEKKETQHTKQKELDDLIARTNADPQKNGVFDLKAPQFSAEQLRQIDYALYGSHKKVWTILNANFREEWTNREVKPSDPLLRLGAKDGPWEIELNIPQKHIGQVQKAFEAMRKKDPDKVPELDVDFLLRSDPTRVFKGKLSADKVAHEANPNKEEGSGAEAAEPVVLAVVRIEGNDILDKNRLPPELLLSGAEVHAKIRCGNKPMYYSLFYGVWEFIYEKIVFFF